MRTPNAPIVNNEQNNIIKKEKIIEENNELDELKETDFKVAISQIENNDLKLNQDTGLGTKEVNFL